MGVAKSEILLEGFLNSRLYEIKQIIPLPHPKILQTVYQALPKRILLQQHQVLFHQLHLFVTPNENQFPQIQQTHLEVPFISPFLL